MATGPLDGALASVTGTVGASAKQVGDALAALRGVLKDVAAVVTATVLPPLKAVHDTLASIGDVLRKVADAATAYAMPALLKLKTALSDLGAIAARVLIPALAPVGAAFMFVAYHVGTALEKLEPLFDRLGAVLGRLGAAAGRGLGYVGDVLGKVGAVAVSAATAFGAIGVAVAGATGALMGLGGTMGTFVEKANPAAMQQFNLVINDLMATVGAALVPLFQLVTVVLRQVADAFTLLIPVGAQLAAALQPLFALLGDVLAGAVGVLSAALKVIVPVLGVVVRLLADFARWLGGLVKQFLDFLGISFDTPEAKKDASVGMAARPAQIGGVDDVLKTAMRNAYSIGLGANDPASATAKAAEAMKNTVERIYQKIEAFPGAVRQYITELPGKIAGALKSAVVGIGEAAVGGSPTSVSSIVGTATNNPFFDQRALDALRALDK